jgi:peroxin-6
MIEFARVQFLVYLVEIVYPKYNAYCFLLYMIVRYWDILKQQQIFTLKAVTSSLLIKFIGESNAWDVNNTVVLNDITGQNDIELAIINLNSDGSVIKRRAYVLRKHFGDDYVALVNNNFAHNVDRVVKCSFKKCHERTLKFADEVEISLVNTVNEWSHFVTDTCLKNYFQIPKLLYEGDIIEVSLKEYGKELFYSSNKVININDKICFKCNKVIYMGRNVKDGYLCAADKVTLKQVANIQSFIPRIFCTPEENMELSLSCPCALENYFEDMKKAIHPVINKNNEKFMPVFLLEGRKGSGKSFLIQRLATYFGMHLHTISNFDISANVYAQNETKLKNIFFSTKMAAPSILEVKNFENFGKNNEGQFDERLINHFLNELKSLFKGNTFPLILFCSSNDKDIPIELKRLFLKTFEIKAPNEQERESILWWIIKTNEIKTDVDLNNIANKTHGFFFEDLRTLVLHAVTEFHNNNNNTKSNLPEHYFLQAVELMQLNYNESLGAPKVPKVKWSDVGGLDNVKEEIIKTVKLPLKYPELVKMSGLKRSGILLFGPPGTGKTLIAKAVATECGLCFLSVKGPELLNMYVGQSEQNVREVFERARDASPCIIFFDELDSLAPNRGASGDSGGVMDRVVSQLLAEMDGLNQSGTIFIIGATNRPDLIDPALLRPGRFDKLLYVGPCVDRDSKISVVRALTRKFNFKEDSTIEQIVNYCPINYSGADFYGVCSSAWMSAARRLITSIENGTRKTTHASANDVIVNENDFQFAIESVKPSIKQEDLDYFHKLKLAF